MSATPFVVHPAVDRLPREPRRIAFQTVLGDFDFMKIIMDHYDFYSNNTLSQLVPLWQSLNISRLALGDLPGDCANYNLSYAASDATRLIVLDLLYDHGFCDFINQLPPSSVRYFLYPLVFALSPTDMEYYFQHDEDAVDQFLTLPYYSPTVPVSTPTISASAPTPRSPPPAPPTLQISRATSPTPPFEEPETPETAHPSHFPISLPSPIVPAITWGEPPNWANEEWDKTDNKENEEPLPEPQPVRRVTGKLKRKRIPVFTFGDILHRRPNTPPPFSPPTDNSPQPDTPSSSSDSLQCLALKKCFKCKKVGHLRVNCSTYTCPSCGELAPGHTRAGCPYLLYCIRCHNKGHREDDCEAHDWDTTDLTDYVVNEGEYDY